MCGSNAVITSFPKQAARHPLTTHLAVRSSENLSSIHKEHGSCPPSAPAARPRPRRSFIRSDRRARAVSSPVNHGCLMPLDPVPRWLRRGHRPWRLQSSYPQMSAHPAIPYRTCYCMDTRLGVYMPLGPIPCWLLHGHLS